MSTNTYKLHPTTTNYDTNGPRLPQAPGLDSPNTYSGDHTSWFEYPLKLLKSWLGLEQVEASKDIAQWNIESQEQMNEKNLSQQERINQINLDYAKEQTQKQWERDDTSYQRSVKDAVAAGFSPLAVLEGGLLGNSGAMNYNAQASQGVAPQIDASTILGSMENLREAITEPLEKEIDFKRDMKKMEQQQTNTMEQLAEQFRNNKEMAEISKANQLEIIKQTMENNFKQVKYEAQIKEQQTEAQLAIDNAKKSKFTNIVLKKESNGATREEVNKHNQLVTQQLKALVDSFETLTSESGSESTSVQAGAHIVTAGGSHSESGAKTYNFTQQQQAQIDMFFEENEYWVFYPKITYSNN